MVKFKKSQKFRIINGQACFYATKKVIDSGVGDFSNFNVALQMAVATLEKCQSGVPKTTGICADFNGIAVQVDVVA